MEVEVSCGAAYTCAFDGHVNNTLEKIVQSANDEDSTSLMYVDADFD